MSRKIVTIVCFVGFMLALALQSIMVSTSILSTSQQPELLTQQEQYPPWIQPQEPKPTYPFEFAACLIVKDDSVLLPEWLAYHYTVLPLRHLIISIDPYSKTVPTEILNLYRQIGMNISMWEGHSHWNDTVPDPTNQTDKQMHQIYLIRQRSFYRACLIELKRRNLSWTALMDSDEYLNYNHFTEAETTSCKTKKNEDRNCQAWKSIRQGTHVRNRLPTMIGRPNETLAHWIASDQDPLLRNATCAVLPRVTYGAKNTSNPVESVPAGIDPQALHTVQFIQNAPKIVMTPGKSLVDVRRYDGVEAVANPHRVFMKQCVNNGFVFATESALRVQHYTGGYEAWMSRMGRRADFFRKRNQYVVEGDDTSMQRWFHEFVELVGGVARAKELTEIPRNRAMVEAMDLVARWHRNETVPPYKAWNEY